MCSSRNTQKMTPCLQSKLFVSSLPFNTKTQSRFKDPFATLAPSNSNKLLPISPSHGIRLPKLCHSNSLISSRIIKVASSFSLLSPRENLTNNPCLAIKKRSPSLLPATPKRELKKQRSKSSKTLPLYSNSLVDSQVHEVSFGCNE